MVVVEAHGLRKAYGETPVLDGLDLELRSGRLHAVTGPSGSGKTTLLHLLAGLELPDGGDDRRRRHRRSTALDRAGRAALRRAKIAYVGQQAGLVPHLSALENVELALALRGLDGRPVRSARGARVGRPRRARDAAGRPPLAGRAGAGRDRARDRLAQPALLLADEPTSRLDGANAISVAILLARLARDYRRRGRLRDARSARDRAGGEPNITFVAPSFGGGPLPPGNRCLKYRWRLSTCVNRRSFRACVDCSR